MASDNSHQAMGVRDAMSYRWYNVGILSFYDAFVLGASCTSAWKAPTSTTILPFFRAHFSRNHLDIGVGSGYFPSAVLAERPDAAYDHQLALYDLSTSALAKTKARVEHAAPGVPVRTIEADATALPAALTAATAPSFDSISASLLLHCIPMPAKQKAAGLVDTARRLLSPRGVFFGCTVLGYTDRASTAPSPTIDWLPGGETSFGPGGESMSVKDLNLFGWALMWFYNRVSVFSNWEDGPDAFVEALEEGFEVVDSWIIGRTLMFRARVPRPL